MTADHKRKLYVTAMITPEELEDSQAAIALSVFPAELTALSRAEETDMDDEPTNTALDLGRIAKALGMTEAARLDDILEAIANLAERNSAKPDPAKYVPIEAVSEFMRSHHDQTAMNAGHLTPAMRGWAVELCRQSPDQFDEFVSSSSAPYARLFERKHRQTIVDPGSAHVDAETAALCRQFDIDPKSLA